MKVVGFNFNKISVERIEPLTEGIKINTKIDISQIEQIKPDLFKAKEELVRVDFIYSIDYDPNFAKVELKGNIIISLEPKISKNLLSQWKDKKMPEDFKMELFNFILRKANVKALQLEDELNLPLHMPFPKIGKQENK